MPDCTRNMVKHVVDVALSGHVNVLVVDAASAVNSCVIASMKCDTCQRLVIQMYGAHSHIGPAKCAAWL
jgi:hypothetical protein